MKAKTVPFPNSEIEALFEHAAHARTHAYCPYSGHAVGSALLVQPLQNSAQQPLKIYSGCNIENASYGATICAERVALQNAISHHGRVQIQTLLVLTQASPPWAPCGLCRQFLSEFSHPQTQVYLANLEKQWLHFYWETLLPHGFTAKQLLTQR